MYSNLPSVSVGPHGWLCFLYFDETKKNSKIFKAKLHNQNPVSEIQLVADNVVGRHISDNVGMVFCWEKASAISLYSIDSAVIQEDKGNERFG